MSEQSGWTQRVETMVAGTMHEQIRQLVREAQDGLHRFSDAAVEQGSLLADAHQTFAEAQRNLEAGVEAVRSEFAEQLRRGIEELNRARENDRHANAQESRSLRAELTAKVGGVGEELKAESERLQTDIAAMALTLENEIVERSASLESEITSRASELETRLRAVEQSIEQVRAAVEETARSTRERFEKLMERMDDTSVMEGRTAKRLVEMLAVAFADLRSGDDVGPAAPLVVGNATEENGWHPTVASAS